LRTPQKVTPIPPDLTEGRGDVLIPLNGLKIAFPIIKSTPRNNPKHLSEHLSLSFMSLTKRLMTILVSLSRD